jgi:hypothetical protein
MGNQLAEFIRSRKAQSGGEIDWQMKKDAWVSSVKGLYRLVKEMLRDSIASKDVIVRTFDTEVTEEFIGTYSIPALELIIGGERVVFRPKGVTVIGVEGRVDIRGARDSVTLLKEKADVGNGWSIILQRVPHLKKAQLGQESLTYALERVMLPLP